MKKNNKLPIVYLVIIIGVIIWSIITPRSYLVWFLESMPVLIGLSVLTFTYKKFRLSNFTYTWIFIAFIIMLIGGHYNYSEVPLFTWLKQKMSLSRNHYDRVGHVINGITTSVLFKEVLWRRGVIRRKGWLYFIIFLMCLGVSATYEIIEFLVAFSVRGKADPFLGMQGDEWDSQWDMLIAFSGVILSNIFFGIKYIDTDYR
ncbi:membrane protein [Clostridium polyendosporum]|uniref:Membrane protein n=1 Tax=Clostridium polyendosporum TaxID=69208 RepID=A0A919RX67_9CLOT|nr:DUF2238 domain-containing protein [Clostridium polyendosporum]GIM27416.1 membrane protein [Clostridium polyendosporum]